MTTKPKTTVRPSKAKVRAFNAKMLDKRLAAAGATSVKLRVIASSAVSGRTQYYKGSVDPLTQTPRCTTSLKSAAMWQSSASANAALAALMDPDHDWYVDTIMIPATAA